jgi:hypothetical protein
MPSWAGRVRRRSLVLLAALAIAPVAWAESPEDAPAAAEPARVWEINGIRLEREQVGRLADDMAERTVAAVGEKVEGIELSEQQRAKMRGIYRAVSLEVFDQVVVVVERGDLADAQKDEEVRRLVLAGQQRSHAALEAVLDARQMELYSRWEKQQVDAYQSRRWDRGARRRRR